MPSSESLPPPASFAGEPYPPKPPIIAQDGWLIVSFFFFPTLFATVVAIGLRNTQAAWLLFPTALVMIAFTVWAFWFFRDPNRKPAAGEDLTRSMICPADGVVVKIDTATPPAEALAAVGEAPAPMKRMCIFMNVFNVHVNRAPLAGTVEAIAYNRGKFFNASFDKASDLNERASLILKLPDGGRLFVIQIAGLIARRIVCKVTPGKVLAAGERYGLIKFGSRVDVYLPPGYEPAVELRTKVFAGHTIIARRQGGV
ncbi:MAG: phosphatidylserine decarboxylase family protein [Planctomycetes bacterium]|nr:phosphatidylserine decarboxylase family protein [Planctomycetota bacterium]